MCEAHMGVFEFCDFFGLSCLSVSLPYGEFDIQPGPIGPLGSLVPLDPRSLVPSFPWTPGPSFPRSLGPPVPRSLGPPVPRSLVPLDPRSLVPSLHLYLCNINQKTEIIHNDQYHRSRGPLSTEHSVNTPSTDTGNKL